MSEIKLITKNMRDKMYRIPSNEKFCGIYIWVEQLDDWVKLAEWEWYRFKRINTDNYVCIGGNHNVFYDLGLHILFLFENSEELYKHLEVKKKD